MSDEIKPTVPVPSASLKATATKPLAPVTNPVPAPAPTTNIVDTNPDRPLPTGVVEGVDQTEEQLKQTPPVKGPTVAEALARLEALSQKWVENHAGEPNHNPFVRVAEMISPIVEAIKKSNQVTYQQAIAIQALPEESPVINPDFVLVLVNRAV